MAWSCVGCGAPVDYHGNPLTGDESRAMCYDCAMLEAACVPAHLLEPIDENVGIARGNLEASIAAIKRRYGRERR